MICPSLQFAGHFGYIALPQPVVNPMFVALVVSILQTVCVHGQRIRLSPSTST